jgi:hypothetical protein
MAGIAGNWRRQKHMKKLQQNRFDCSRHKLGGLQSFSLFFFAVCLHFWAAQIQRPIRCWAPPPPTRGPSLVGFWLFTTVPSFLPSFRLALAAEFGSGRPKNETMPAKLAANCFSWLLGPRPPPLPLPFAALRLAWLVGFSRLLSWPTHQAATQPSPHLWR